MTRIFDTASLRAPVTAAVDAAAATLLARFSPDARPADRAALVAMIEGNDAAVMPALRSALVAARPGSAVVEDELAGGPLPPGAWWIVDPAEGNINHVHGSPRWGVTATLVEDGFPVFTAMAFPALGETYVAARGGGAFVGGRPLHVSRKTELAAAIVATGQARPGEDSVTLGRIAASVRTMLSAALLVRMAVPATLELIDLAAGRLDIFWQHSQVRSGLAAGALLAIEAGAVVTDIDGNPWSFESRDLLAAAPGIHRAAVAAFAGGAAS